VDKRWISKGLSVSREALALDISRIVSRVVSGEAVDTVERGAALAAKYPEVGMSGESISEAIARAAGMVGMIKSAPPPQRMPPVTRSEPVAAKVAVEPPGAPEVALLAKPSAPAVEAQSPLRADPAIPPSAQAIDDLLAAAIDAEIGDLVSGRRPPDAPGRNGSMPALPDGTPAETPAEHGTSRKGPLAALRRALFKD
jgi:hypothetical protein